MMMALLVLKTRLKGLYERHYKVIRSILKIFVSAGIFAVVLYNLPFRPELKEYVVPLVIMTALICGFIPDLAVMCLVLALVIYEISAVSMIAAFGFFVALTIYFLLFGRYTKTQSYIVVLIPVLSVFNLSYVVPVVAALFLPPVMIPACAVGVLVQYVITGIKNYEVISRSAVDTGNTMESLQYIVNYVLQNREMLIYMAAFAITYVLVFLIRKGRYNHASHVGILVGIVACMAGVISGDILYSIETDTNKLLIGLAFSALIAYVIQFFRMSLDYTGVRNLQFEDDEYFYYVKAVPKMKVAVVDKTVTRIEEVVEDERIDLKEEIEKVLEEDLNPDSK